MRGCSVGLCCVLASRRKLLAGVRRMGCRCRLSIRRGASLGPNFTTCSMLQFRRSALADNSLGAIDLQRYRRPGSLYGPLADNIE